MCFSLTTMRSIFLGVAILGATTRGAAFVAPTVRVRGELHPAAKDIVELSGSIGNTGLSGPEVYATIWEDVGERRADDGKLSEWQHKCSQPGPLFPENSDSLSKMQKYIATEEFLEASARRVSGAVQINTTSADGMQSLPGDDQAWNHMRPLSRVLGGIISLGP